MLQLVNLIILLIVPVSATGDGVHTSAFITHSSPHLKLHRICYVCICPTCRKNLFKSSIRVHPLQYRISAALVNVNNMLINGSGVLVLQRSHRRQAVHLSVEEVHSITTWQQKGCFDNWPLKTLSNNLLTPINPSGTKYLQLINLETLLLIPVYMKRELWCRRYTCLFIPRLSESTPGRQLKGVATVLL